jgi:glycerol kinase
MKWLLENVDGLDKQNNLVLSTIDSYLISRLTGGKSNFTDSTNASRTMLMDINTLEWSDKMLNEYSIKKEWLPTIIKESSGNFGTVSTDSVKSLAGVSISGVAGD